MMEYGLIGEKLPHSFSKLLHESFADYTYELKEIERENLSSFMKKKDFKGINVTIPYKKEVIPYLDYIDPSAREIGAVNTVVNRNGKLYGYNTDFYGLKALITRSGTDLNGKKVIILGSGGTSLTVREVAKSLGAKEILRVSRSARNGAISYNELYALHSDGEIIIDTTPVGMYPNIYGSVIKLSCFNKALAVFDVVYNPIRTELVLEAQRRGLTAQGGLYMLCAQAVAASELFTGTKYPESVTLKAYKHILELRRNIVLIGMPGSGKSTVGKILASKFGCEFTDCDAEIVKLTGSEITEIFKTKGEKFFRQTETDIIKHISLNTVGSVISTGGGAILKPENVLNLKRNGKVYFLDRKPEDIIPTADRPLGDSAEKIKQRYKERYNLYVAAADRVIKVSGGADEVADFIAEDLKNES